MAPTLILVGADKGGVGKTTVSRLLLDYLGTRNTPTRAFDSEFPRGTLKRFHPDQTEIVDLTETSHQMTIIDSLEGAGSTATIVDIRAGRLNPTLQTLRDIGFLDAARDGQFTLCVFHVLGTSISSLEEIETTAPFVANANYYLVKNHINDTSFFEWDPKTYGGFFDRVKSAGEISIPKLNELAYEQVEVAGVPFSQFVMNRTANNEPGSYSFVLRGHVRTWLKQVEGKLDSSKFLDALGGKKGKRAQQG